MPSSTTYNPQNMNEFEKSKLNKDAQGVQATITAQGVSNIDLVLADDELVMGGAFLVNMPAQGDKVDFQVLNGATVVAQFVTNWYIDPTSVKQMIPTSNFPAKVFAGLTLRVVYHATGPTGLGGLLNSPIWVAINYDMQKVLI